MMNLEGRHQGTQHVAQFFTFDHLPEGPMRDISAECARLAEAMINALPDGPELTAALRHLLEAKDCAVRAALIA